MWTSRDASERIVSYYSYLFTFPSRGAMAGAIVIISISGCAAAFAMTWGVAAALRGLLFGLLGLTFPLLASDALSSALFKDDAFLTPRRFTILSYASSIVYAGAILLSSATSTVIGGTDLLVRGVMFAIAVNASLRYLVVQVFSNQGVTRNMAATFMQPIFCFVSGALLSYPAMRIPVLGAIGTAITVGGIHLLLLAMSRTRNVPRGMRLIPLFRAFVMAWAEELNEPLEDQITRVGEVRDLFVDSLIYRDESSGCKAALVVPYIHPGPFRNVGSSALPNTLSMELGKRLGCEVLVPHGISTHERDLTSSDETARVARVVASNLPIGEGAKAASPFVRVVRHGAKASCQMFGDVALVTLTLSPKSHDDLPEELSDRIMEASSTMGVTAAVVDSHNSLLQRDELDDSDVENLFQAAVEAIKRAKEGGLYGFSVGVARAVPSEWGLDDGMGPDGVAALAVRLDNNQTCVYVIVDGNNMRSGLRERIVDALRSHGIDEVEVLTTDTHVVNAIGATSRGYYPIGERMDEGKFMEYVVYAAESALLRLGECSASHARVMVHGLTVLGAVGLELLNNVLESAFDLFKRTALAVTPPSLLLAAAVIFFL